MSYLKISLIKNIIKDLNAPCAKPYSTMLKEFIILWYVHKEFPSHYYSRFLYRKEFIHYRKFIPNSKYFKIIKSKNLHNPLLEKILTNKLLFSFFCKEHRIPSPQTISYNTNNNFYYEGRHIKINDGGRLIKFLDDILAKSKNQKIVVKNIDAKGGAGIFVILKKTLVEQVKEHGHLILSGAYIHQECLEQHMEINTIYTHSINTIRMDIIVDGNGKRHFLGSVIRFGSEGRMIDNRSKGGFFVSIDDNTGRLLDKGYTQMKYGGKEYTKHPDTRFEFKDFKVPFYHEAKELAMKMSSILPNSLVGWDIAISPDGPVIIEGNHDSNITMTELSTQGYLNHPAVNELIINS